MQVVHDGEVSAEAAAAAPAAGSGGPVPRPANPKPCDGHAAPSRLSFYLDGAHTEESMATCGTWFADAVVAAREDPGPQPAPDRAPRSGLGQPGGAGGGEVQHVLLFNCMPASPLPYTACVYPV